MQIIPLETNVSHVTKWDRTLPAAAFVVSKHDDEPPCFCFGASQDKRLEGKAITLREQMRRSHRAAWTTSPATNKLHLGPTAPHTGITSSFQSAYAVGRK